MSPGISSVPFHKMTGRSGPFLKRGNFEALLIHWRIFNALAVRKSMFQSLTGSSGTS